MAVILRFPKEPLAPGARPDVERGRSAQILFFTGVRYERVTVSAPKRQRRARRPRNPQGAKSA